jgi:hypothetical protein
MVVFGWRVAAKRTETFEGKCAGMTCASLSGMLTKDASALLDAIIVDGRAVVDSEVARRQAGLTARAFAKAAKELHDLGMVKHVAAVAGVARGCFVVEVEL